MKKLCCIMGVILLMMSVFAGCTPEEEKVYDEAFLNDFKKGLMARWDQASDDNSADRSTFEALINLELDRLNEYSDKKFEDTQLQQDAITYINLLKKQKEALTYYSGDITKYTELWDEAYSARAQLITQIIDKYELKFPDKYNETIEGFMSTAKVAHEKAEMDKKIE
ncbi:MAG: hypothetical protein U0M60_16820, partial [Clostridia bacterium]|nr:hypothetical protein [Clostridia bacterium]